ncbi:MAG TPA: SUMF1/EgtB/PvdO family nonheme iron enzyme [Anaerolineaceae bacterium]
MDFFKELAKRLTPFYAAIVMIIVAILWWGTGIPTVAWILIYILAIGLLVIYTLQSFLPWIRNPPPPPGNDGKKKPDEPGINQNPPPPPPPTPTVPPVKAYLEGVIVECQALRLVGIDPKAADTNRARPRLEKVYVSLDTQTTLKVKKEKRGKEDEPEREETRILPAIEALATAPERRMVLLGLPGTGKSTLARYLAFWLAKALLEPATNLAEKLPGWTGGALLPITISLGRMAETLPQGCRSGSAETIERYLQDLLATTDSTKAFAPLICQTIREKGTLVIFDGLDEVADLTLRPVIVQAVQGFYQRYAANPASRFLVTCRTYSYKQDARWQLAGWQEHELALFDKDKIEQFIKAWHDEYAFLEPKRKEDFERKKASMLAALGEERRRLYEIAPFPLILTIMAIVHNTDNDLPKTRARVYDRCITILVEQWEKDRSIGEQLKRQTLLEALQVDRSVVNSILYEVAYRAHEGRESEAADRYGLAYITERLLRETLYTHFSRLPNPSIPAGQRVDIFMEYCNVSSALLALQGNIRLADSSEDTLEKIYAFPHLTFEEYLAGKYLIKSGVGRRLRGLVDSSDRWREVALLASESMLYIGDTQWELLDGILKALSTPKKPNLPDDKDWRALWLAGEVVSLYWGELGREDYALEKQIVKDLRGLIEAGALSLPERARAADTLDALGWQPADLYDFVPIDLPADDGRFQPFRMAKYLVTNQQYARFCSDPENFRDPTLWLDFPQFDENCQPMKNTGKDGWEWLESQRKDEQGCKTPGYWDDPRFGRRRKGAPVVGVTWWEANAYCRWLQRNWNNLNEGRQNPGLNIALARLPREIEWALAAGGEKPQGRYPWDAPGEATTDLDAVLQRANVDESQINRTTPVGMYPLGVSHRYRLHDMAGNVWEWQGNYHDKDHDVFSLRGGSWFSSMSDARAANRYGNRPNLNWHDFGFRVVVVPS